jgi:hypothetical protein
LNIQSITERTTRVLAARQHQIEAVFQQLNTDV